MLAGCGIGDAESEAVPLPGLASADSVYSPEVERVALPRERIYYTLTTHEWYARGEPLLHDGMAFRPAGLPIAAPVTEMIRVGEFRGVEYYVRDGADAATVYVPVFEGYWQAFRMAAEIIDTTMTAPPPPDPDTTSRR